MDLYLTTEKSKVNRYIFTIVGKQMSDKKGLGAYNFSNVKSYVNKTNAICVNKNCIKMIDMKLYATS